MCRAPFSAPASCLGDTRRPETTQFDMVRAFVFLAGLPVLPLRPTDRIDIVPVDYVADAVIALHRKVQPEHEIYHLSSGRRSETFRELTDCARQARGKDEAAFLAGSRGSIPFDGGHCLRGAATAWDSPHRY